jgi:hypothetical protein
VLRATAIARTVDTRRDCAAGSSRSTEYPNEQGRKWNGEQEETHDPGREVDRAVAVGELGQCSHLVEEIWVGDSPHYQLVTYGFSEHAQQQWLGNDTEAFRVTV